MKLKKIVLKIFISLLLITSIFAFIFSILEVVEEQVQASSSNGSNASDVQLLARAINRRSQR